MSLVKVKDKFQVTIPTKIRKQARLGVGDLLEVAVQNKTILLKPKALVDRDSAEAGIREGLRDYRKGRVLGPFRSVKEFKASIKRA